MSQFYLSVTSTPSVPTQFVLDDGTAIPAANSLNVLGVDSTENNANGILTRANPNLGDDAYIVLTNRLQGTASSVNAANADIITFALGASATVYRFQFDVTGRDTGTGDGVGYTVFASARTNGAAATIIASIFSDNDEDASLTAATIDLVASANNVILRAVGVAGQTLNYSAVGSYVQV